MFPPKKKSSGPDKVGVAVMIGKPKPKSRPVSDESDDDLGAPDPVEGKADEPDMEDSTDDSGYDTGEGYGAKLEKDIEQAGAALGMDAGQAKQAAGAFFMAAAKCLMGGGEGDQESSPDGDEMIDTSGPMRPGRYGQ